MANPTITIKFENGKEIKAELYPGRAPFNVQFLLDGIETYEYEWVPVHTAMKDVAIALGFYDKNGYGRGYGEEFEELFREDTDEYEQIGSKEIYPHECGTLALVEPRLPETWRQQLAVILTDKPVLAVDGKPVVLRPIGRVTEGLEYARELSHVETNEDLTPKTTIMVENVYPEGGLKWTGARA
ncbi:MAG: peptidylprolyl isomerase [Clostridia bacterium]|nr:peptidylprolyl isomerase [Clostridia bacterium]